MALTLLFGAICTAGGFLWSELSTFYSSIRMEWIDGVVSGVIPQHFGNRDNFAIATAICNGGELAVYEENITVAGGADFVRFECAN
ncbi:hypothetical protein [Gymnodinialimonas hymeniacidonis]|uniref:hypothetical protein n=1 Tax=Gymnodinialimonas hymeniacidonis TaxID=3126508 RepID=UPI0034C6C2C9